MQLGYNHLVLILSGWELGLLHLSNSNAGVEANLEDKIGVVWVSGVRTTDHGLVPGNQLNQPDADTWPGIPRNTLSA